MTNVSAEKLTQLDRFTEAAREVEADESDDALDKAMRKLDLTKKPDEKDAEDADSAKGE